MFDQPVVDQLPHFFRRVVAFVTEVCRSNSLWLLDLWVSVNLEYNTTKFWNFAGSWVFLSSLLVFIKGECWYIIKSFFSNLSDFWKLISNYLSFKYIKFFIPMKDTLQFLSIISKKNGELNWAVEACDVGLVFIVGYIKVW